MYPSTPDAALTYIRENGLPFATPREAYKSHMALSQVGGHSPRGPFQPDGKVVMQGTYIDACRHTFRMVVYDAGGLITITEQPPGLKHPRWVQFLAE